MAPPRLPPEVLLRVAELVLPPPSREPIAHRPSSAETRTLVALTLTSRTFYPLAIQLLHTHCLYIESAPRLRRLLTSLSTPPLPSLLAHRPPTLRRCLTSLFLSPFGATLDDLPVASWTHELLALAAPHLRRLVVDMPLRTLYPEDDHLGVRPVLRRAFDQLEAIEECVSVRDELYLAEDWGWVLQPLPWGRWHGLRRLALYNQDVGSGRFWDAMAKVPGLEKLVLTRADGLADVDLWMAREGWRGSETECLLVDVESGHSLLYGEKARKARRLTEATSGAEEVVRADRDAVTVQRYNVPVSYYGDENEIELCQEWVKDAAIRRVLWDWRGEVL